LTWLVADELHILNVATDPTYRRRGIGQALVERAIAFARERRVRLVLLEVRRSNLPAIRLYRSFGFCVLGIRRGYYGDNGEDAIEMGLVLDPETGDIVPSRDEVRLEEV
jgi:ribosomal-protein-alanine N-acetyltransferase